MHEQNGTFLKVAGTLLGFVVVFAAVVGFAVRADMKADTVAERSADQEMRLRSIEATLPSMAADIRTIRTILELEIKARREP